MMYMILGSNKNYDEMAESIHQQDFIALRDFLEKKFVETVQSTASENSESQFNQEPVTQSEIKQKEDEELVDIRRQSIRMMTCNHSIFLHPTYFEEDPSNPHEYVLPKFLKRMGDKEDPE